MEFLSIIVVLMIIIVLLGIMAVAQIKMAGMRVTDF